MGREVWDMVSDFGSEECGVAPLLHRQTVGSILSNWAAEERQDADAIATN